MEDVDVGPNTDNSLSGVTDRFSFVDGSSEGLEFFAEPLTFPWIITQPDDEEGGDDCIV